MVRFGGMPWKRVKALVCLVTASVCLSSCSMTRIDEMRPEVNREQAMIVDPDAFMQSVGMEQGDWDTGDGDIQNSNGDGPRLPGMSWGGATEGVISGDQVTAEEDEYTDVTLDAQTVSATSYSRYLSEKVVSPIVALCDKMDPKPYDKLYFRVVHRGYDPVGVDQSNVMAPTSSPYDFKFIGGLTKVDGYVISEFAFKYLDTIDGNSSLKESKRRSVINAVQNSRIDNGTSWLGAAEFGRLSSAIKEMWGNERLEAESSVRAYLQAVNRSVIGTVPDMILYVQNGTAGAVHLNKTTGSARYRDNVSTYALNAILSAPNQYPDHKPIRTLHDFDYDDHCIIWCNIDGWSCTIAILGCDETTTLPELFGGDYDAIHDLMANICKNTDWAQICAMEGMADAFLISAGARGTE